MRPSTARRVAFGVVRRVFEEDAWTDRAFRAMADRAGLEGRPRAQAQRLAYGAVQRRGTTDHFAERLAGRPLERLDPPLRAALRLGLFELLFADATPDHAAVAEAVELAKEGMPGDARRGAAAAGVVNAVLRRAARERSSLLEELDDSTPQGAAVAHSCPLWLVEMWWAELGAEGARDLLRAVNRPSETALRVNRLRGEGPAVVARLAEAGEVVTAPQGVPADALVVSGPLGPVARELIATGVLVPQSRGSQAVVEVLGPRPGERVLDLCAGPGIKTSAIAERTGVDGSVVAVEADAGRARQIEELCARLGAAGVEVRHGDARDPGATGAGYDRVLVDPPCSDLGTLASRPDVRWRKSRETIAELASLQPAILAQGAAALRPGGTLVYSTCTISRRENEEVVSAALARSGELEGDDLSTGHPALASSHDPRFLQIRPDRDGTDGFFIARLRRAEAAT